MKWSPRSRFGTAGLLALAMLVMLAVTCRLSADEPFDYFRNSWNVIGLRDYEHGTRVTPDNKLLLADGAEVRIRFGEKLTALSRNQTKTLMDGWLPIVLIAAEDGPVRYEFTLWATPLPTVDDWQKAFDWPTEGENFLNWILVKVTNTGSQTASPRFEAETKGPSRHTVMENSWSLPPGTSAEAAVWIPFAQTSLPKLSIEDARLWLERTRQYWRDLILSAARIEVPCRKATEALLAAHVCQLIANDHGELQGGEGFYDQFYIRDGGYQIMELEEAGLGDAAAKAVDHYLKRQRDDGRFETQKDQFDANGQAIWVLWQYYKITGDRQWLQKAYPQMRRAVDWMMKARREAPADSPFAGVLPNAPADGEYLWDGKHHIVGYDIWNLRGLLCTADAARALGKTDEAEDLFREAELYRAAIDAAWKRTGLAHFPPSWETDGTHWGNTETLWPTELFDRDDPRVTALIRHVREEHGGGYVEGTILWLGHAGAIHPYMGAYTTMASLVRGEHEQVAEDFYWYLLHSAATHAFPEGIYYQRRFAWSNTIPHVTGASNYAVMLRHMLIHERGDELHLLVAAPDWWLGEGQEIRVERAPTHFGPMGMTVRGTAEGVKVELEPPTRQPPTRQPPKRIVLHLPESRPLVGSLEGVEVVTRSDQRKRWDFPTVVELYLEEAAVLFKPIPGLVALPLDSPLETDQCRMLDLTAAANTDPFTAPFGVPQPPDSRYLFTGLPVGRQMIGGVPFRIIDPKENDGRALVVLHSPKAPENRTWPHEVEIPVGEQGKRVFFLGNVHGWSSQDPGTGEWGAVAEYVIHYADGQTQTVPLITGRTADEWAASPEADEVLVGLRGKTWHLNVIGAELRPVKVEKITFRDLDTPAAPVLAAVTLEK
jgi:hypothetical protein